MNKVTSEINRFQVGNINWKPIQERRQGYNPRVNWFYLLEPPENEKIRCFTESETNQVISFLDNAYQSQFGNKTKCFKNISKQDCNDNYCEDEVANEIRNNGGNPNIPNKILPSDFGKNGISKYKLGFNIIGYFY